MRRVLKTFGIFCFIGVLTAYAQYFEGVITFKSEVVGQNADQMKALMPTSYIMKFKGKKSRIEMKGGMVEMMGMGTTIYDGDRYTYILNSSQKKAQKMDVYKAKDDVKEEVDKPQIKKLGPGEKILGYNTVKYEVKLNTSQGPLTQVMWIAPDIKVEKNKAVKNAQSFMVEGVEGFPLKIVQNMDNLGVKIILTATQVEKQRLSDSEFEIPSDYTVEEMNINQLRGNY